MRGYVPYVVRGPHQSSGGVTDPISADEARATEREDTGSFKVAECYKGRMVLGGSGKVSFGRRIREDPLSPYSE